VDIAVKAIALARDSGNVPGMKLHIYGEGTAEADIRELVEKLKVGDAVFIRPPLPLREIASVMANADLGVVPKRNDSFGGQAFSTKTLEFMALGVPVVVANTTIDTHYFTDDVVRFFRAGDERDLACVIADAYRNRQVNVEQAHRALRYVERYSWPTRKLEYLALVDQLVNER
jgi:glycosyltransferase involved in cell wall biosynthesis